MKKKNYNWAILLLAILGVSTVAMSFISSTENVEQNNKINWLTLDELQVAQKSSPKPVIVDLYTSWCVWCKKMDENTFTDPNLINYINKNFYAVKFDAESEADIQFKGNSYGIQTVNNRKVHQLAWQWGNVNNRIGYPTLVILDENLDKIQAFPGFKDVEAMQSLAKYFGEKIYKTKSWQDYLSSGK